MSTLPVLTTLCPICYNNPLKYCCPRCSMRTCSLECFQAHKQRASCSGKRDPAKYIPRREMKSSTVDMDFNFLKDVERTRVEAKSEARKANAIGWSKDKKGRHRESAKLKAKELGIIVRDIPRWTERASKNRTHWDSEKNAIVWTVEWIISVDQETKTIWQHELANVQQVSNGSVVDGWTLAEAFNASRLDNENSKAQFLMKNARHSVNDNNSYCLLDREKTILENLKGRTVLGFPTIYVVTEIPAEWTVKDHSATKPARRKKRTRVEV